MFINPNLYIALPMALLLFWIGFRAARLRGGHHFLWIISLLLAGVTLLFPLAYVWDGLAEQPLYCALRTLPGAELSVALIGLPAGLLARRRPRRLLLIMLLAVSLGYTMIPFVKPILRPFPDGALRSETRWADDVCLQSTASTCGPASLCTILRALGVDAEEAELARAAFSCSSGTENWYLARTARARGLSAAFLRCEEIGDVPTPAIVGVGVGGAGHFVVLLENNGGLLTVGDPLIGRLVLTAEEFRARYPFDGFVLRVAS